MDTSAEYQVNFRNLKETEEGVEVYLFLQNLKNIYNINDIVGTYICSKVKNIINNFRHKAKRAIYEELKANEIVSSKIDNIVASSLKESKFEKLFEYYSGVSYEEEFTDDIVVPLSYNTNYNVHEKYEHGNKAMYLPSNKKIPIANTPSSTVGNSKESLNTNNKETKRVIVEYFEHSYIIHLKHFNSISNLKSLLCKEMNLKKETLKNSTIKYFCSEIKNWVDVKPWALLNSNETLHIFNEDDSMNDIKPHIEIEETIFETDVCNSPASNISKSLTSDISKSYSEAQELIEEYKRSGGNAEWVKEFKFPEFDSKISQKMVDGKSISAMERTKVCQVITDCMKKFSKNRITEKEIELILKLLIFKYPRLYDMEEDKWITYNVWKLSLANMLEKQTEKQTKNISKPTSESGVIPKTNNVKRKSLTPVSGQKKKRDERTSMIPRSEEQSEIDYSRRPERVSAGMKATFEERRMQIVSENWGIEDIFSSYPWLYNENEIFAEFSRIVGIDFQVDKMIETEFRKLTEPLLYILKYHHKNRIVSEKEKEIKAIEKKNKSNNFSYKMTLFALPLAIGEDVETIFKQSGSYYDEPIQIEYTGSDLYNAKAYSVVIECSKIECSNLKRAVAVYFCSFFIFNLAYPSDIKKFMYSIERNVLKIPGNAPPPVSVVKLFKKISDFVSGELSS